MIHKATLLITKALKEHVEPGVDYSDVHSVPFSKNTYTFQSVHTFFVVVVVLHFYYQK